jgi:hypothetical protein
MTRLWPSQICLRRVGTNTRFKLVRLLPDSADAAAPRAIRKRKAGARWRSSGSQLLARLCIFPCEPWAVAVLRWTKVR